MDRQVTSKEKVGFNVNDHVRVKLKQRARDELLRQHRELYTSIGRPDEWYRAPTEDADGWSRWQLWDLMNRFGHMCGLGLEPPFETEIQFERPSPEPRADAAAILEAYDAAWLEDERLADRQRSPDPNTLKAIRERFNTSRAAVLAAMQFTAKDVKDAYEDGYAAATGAARYRVTQPPPAVPAAHREGTEPLSRLIGDLDYCISQVTIDHPVSRTLRRIRHQLQESSRPTKGEG